MLQFTFMQLFVLFLFYTITIASLLIVGIDLGYKLLNNKKPIKNNIIPEIPLPVELQPKSIYEVEDNENHFLR